MDEIDNSINENKSLTLELNKVACLATDMNKLSNKINTSLSNTETKSTCEAEGKLFILIADELKKNSLLIDTITDNIIQEITKLHINTIDIQSDLNTIDEIADKSLSLMSDINNTFEIIDNESKKIENKDKPQHHLFLASLINIEHVMFKSNMDSATASNNLINHNSSTYSIENCSNIIQNFKETQASISNIFDLFYEMIQDIQRYK